MERRTLRRDRQDLLDLQLSLKAEIEAKSKIAEDLSNVTAQHAEMERWELAQYHTMYSTWSFTGS